MTTRSLRLARRISRPVLGFALPLLAMLITAFASAPAVADEKLELQQLRQRLDQMKRDLAKTEGTRAEAADQLRAAETSISDTNRKMRQIGARQTDVRKTLRGLEGDIRQLEGDIGGRSQNLSRFLYARYIAGERDAGRVIFSGDDPHRIARELYYLGYVSRAQTDIIRGLRTNVQDLEGVAEKTRKSMAELAQLEKEERDERAKLERQRGERRTLLASLSGQVKVQQQQIQTAQQNEQRLTQLVERLTRLLQERAERAERERKERERAAKAGKQAPPTAKNDKVPEAGEFGGVFSTLKGRLRLPIRGELASRFGSARTEGGPSWKGVFIRGKSGDEVRAVAPGRVVFSDWMRGFGNLLILDHGQGYLTIYGNNESLLKQAGDIVKTGDSVATVGANGSSEDSGLYFELRHQGRALDPLAWVGR